jgi:hypothetical protein
LSIRKEGAITSRAALAEIAGEQHDIVESLAGDLCNHNVQEDRVIADFDQRLGRAAGQLAEACSFAPDQDASLAYGLRCHAGGQDCSNAQDDFSEPLARISG